MSTFGRKGFFALLRKFWPFLEMPKMRNANSNMAFWHLSGGAFLQDLAILFRLKQPIGEGENVLGVIAF